MPRENNGEGVATNGRLLDMMLEGTTFTDIHRSGKDLTLWRYIFDIPIWANKFIGVANIPLEFARPCCQGNSCNLGVGVPKRRTKAYLLGQTSTSTPGFEAAKFCLLRHSDYTREGIGSFVSFFESPNAH